MKLPADHSLKPWSFVHAAWLLNRYQQGTAFEAAFGRPYKGKITYFGEYVQLYHRVAGCKMGPQWIPGVWLGKTSEGNEDQHVVSTVNGVMKGKAIRRSPDPWRAPWLFLMRDKPYKSVSSKKAVKFDTTPLVLPKIVKDIDAEDVERHALEHGDSEDEAGEPIPLADSHIGSSMDMEQKATQKREASTSLEELEHERDLERIGDQVPQTPEQLHAEVLDDSEILERETKTARMSPPTSPTSGSVLFPPHYAGGVRG